MYVCDGDRYAMGQTIRSVTATTRLSASKEELPAHQEAPWL
jgi:hypothetical protein